MEIYLRDLHKTLDTRESASSLIAKITKEFNLNLDSRIVLNFEDIEFMSRSFADQFHKEITADDFNIDLIFSNLHESIRETLRIVEKTQNSRSKLSLKKKTIHLRFDSIEKIENYLYSLQ